METTNSQCGQRDTDATVPPATRCKERVGRQVAAAMVCQSN